MCRITGFWDFNEKDYSGHEVIQKMTDTLKHGGPDNEGFYTDKYVFLGHRRLSIIDLSDAGKQPMIAGKYVIVFNGEIYNYQSVRSELIADGIKFSTHTDTEVILNGFSHWGIDVVNRFRGMFAFCIWNAEEFTLTLCRDRFGVKPLYYYWKDGLFIFSSELKAFHHHPHFKKKINKSAVSTYLSKGYISQPDSIFEDVHKLKTGSFLTININQQIEVSEYYSTFNKYETLETDFRSEKEIVKDLEVHLKESFHLRMVADVPVGMFLSGGIDSSLVTAMLQSDSALPLNTFTIGFKEKKYNEADIAELVSRKVGTKQFSYFCTEDDILSVIDEYSEIFDEPFGAESAIPTYLLSKFARQEVKVCLSADAGDELFGGYSKYRFGLVYQNYLSSIPIYVRVKLGSIMNLIDPEIISDLPYFNRFTDLNTKYRKLSAALDSDGLFDFLNKSSNSISDIKLSSLSIWPKQLYKSKDKIIANHIMSYMCVYDMNTFIEGHVLTKVDRATMYTALEGREPFLDQYLFEFCLSIPDNVKYKDKTSKYLLKKILQKYLPESIINRPKQGFTIPVEKWLKSTFYQQLLLIGKDEEFCNYFELNWKLIDQNIHEFLNNNEYNFSVSPHFFWYLLILYKWYKRWI